jgi:hypothetical protein
MKPYRLLISVLLGLALLVQGVSWAAPAVLPQQTRSVSVDSNVMPCEEQMMKSSTKAHCNLCGTQCSCASACIAAPAVVASFDGLTLDVSRAEFQASRLDAQAVSPHTLDTLRPPIVRPS